MTQKDEIAFSRLVEAYQNPVYNLCYHMLGGDAAAEEAAQEAFCQAYRQRRCFDADRQVLKWLLTIAYRRCIRMLPRKNGAAEDPDMLVLSGQAADISKVQALLDNFTPENRAAIILRCCYGFADEEIAEITCAAREPAAGRLKQSGKVQLRNILTFADRRAQPKTSAPSLQ